MLYHLPPEVVEDLHSWIALVELSNMSAAVVCWTQSNISR